MTHQRTSWEISSSGWRQSRETLCIAWVILIIPDRTIDQYYIIVYESINVQLVIAWTLHLNEHGCVRNCSICVSHNSIVTFGIDYTWHDKLIWWHYCICRLDCSGLSPPRSSQLSRMFSTQYTYYYKSNVMWIAIFHCSQTRYYLLIFWSILMSIFTLMAFMVPTDLEAQTARPFTFFNSSGAIQPDFLSYWGSAYRPVLYTFGSIHLILSRWMLLEYFIINWPNFRLPSLYYNLLARYSQLL